MIQFHLDPGSGVATYLQIVQQVKEALRLGTIEVGDQLPTVREVVADLAINPNTVAKAYRISSATVWSSRGRGAARSSRARWRRRRCGITTHFVPSSSSGSRRRRAGLDDESIRALISTTLRERDQSRWHEPRARRRGPRQALPSRLGAARLTLTIPEGSIVGLAGPNAAGKSTLLALAAGLLAPTDGSIAVLGCDPVREPWCSPRSASCPRGHRSTARSRSATRSSSRDGRTRAGSRDRRDLLTRLDARQGRRSPPASAPSSPSRSCSASGRGCCCSTSRSRGSIRLPGASSCSS